MKVSALASAIALAATLALPASAQDRTNALGNGVAPMATTDPEIMIYRVSGIRDNAGQVDSGIATSFHCSSNSQNQEKIRVRIFDYLGALLIDDFDVIEPKGTTTISTHNTKMFSEDLILIPGTHIGQGSAAIIATSKQVFCTAMMVDAGAAVPGGIALHMVRFNPAPGSVE